MATKSESKNRKGHGDVVGKVEVDDSSFATGQNAEVVDESSSLQERDEVERGKTPSSDNHPEDEEKSDDAASPISHDSVDGNFISLPMNFIDGKDDEINVKEPLKVQLYSLNQKSGKGGGFLKMELDGDRFKVTTTGERLDPHAIWLAHITVDGEFREIVIFKNEACSRQTQKHCVLYTHQNDEEDYLLIGKEVDAIPQRFIEIEPCVGFIKRPKSIGSELLFLKSMLTTKDRPLLVGFDGAGQPIPLNKVKKYSADFQAFFRVLEGG